jgi:hypothetical protein
LVRVLVDAAERIRDVHEVEQLDHPLARSPPGEAHVLAQDLLDLLPDPENGIERGHRLLEDERDLSTADLAQLRPRCSE